MTQAAAVLREQVQQTIGGPPSELTLSVFTTDQRIQGWYEGRRPQGTLHERVRATAWGFRTYIADGRIVTEVIVLPHERNASFGFVPLNSFVIPETGGRVGGIAPQGSDLDRPF